MAKLTNVFGFGFCLRKMELFLSFQMRQSIAARNRNLWRVQPNLMGAWAEQEEAFYWF
ncbi:hypothetical protein BT93_C1653 [Corymbia citriodora subsp. variegata]|nr:hypothetical protein BT93_C1653 [Corymbia citriodora subsp. variegata]